MDEGVVTVNDVLDGHTVLDLSCLDRLYLSGLVQKLQTLGGVVFFLHEHRGMPLASPAVFDQIGSRFRDGVRRFAETNHIPVVRLRHDDRKVDVMRPYLDRTARTGRSQVATIGVAQEFAPVWTARRRDTDPTKPPAVLLHQAAAAAGHRLLRVRVGRRLRPRVHQDLLLFPLPDQGLGQRP